MRDDDITKLLQEPHRLGVLIGFPDLTPLHSKWIRSMLFGTEDYTLQAHRGSFKSSCLALAISLIMVMFPTRNIIFIRGQRDGLFCPTLIHPCCAIKFVQ